ASGVDFAHYKYNTLQRRITRRMVLHKLQNLSEYIRMLTAENKEVEALYQDILIGVTSFFRNAESYDALKRVVFPALVANASGHEQLRVWALGCSTGEEAYSIAMSFSEFIETTSKRVSMQIFATDLNAHGIEKARYGLYSKGITQDVSPERLRRFFVEVDGNYRISKPIRDMCIFARQNVLADPPFSRLDLVACRNVMIYLEPVLQRKLVPILHYALRNQGYLWLGSSETIGQHRELFDLLEPKHKFYVRKTAVRTAIPMPMASVRMPAVPHGTRPPPRDGIASLVDTQKEVERQILARYSPPGVVLDDALDIIQFRGDTSPYLSPASGKPTVSLLKMLREGLMVAVRGAVHKAKREGHAVREEGLRADFGGGTREVDVVAIPLDGSDFPSGTILLLFEESAQSITARARQMEAQVLARVSSSSKAQGATTNEPEFSRLKQELSATRDYLQSVIEQHEATNEELQSANEEVQSANEELQSINEELETSKEEIQSSNEELATVNDELQTRNVELSQSNNDLLNLLTSVQMAILMLGPDLRVRRFTPTAEKLFNLSATDIGRPIRDLNLGSDLGDLEALVIAAMDTVNPQEREVQSRTGQWFSLRVRPYRTFENKIDGAVLMLVDIDTLKRSEQAVRESEGRFEVLADSAPVLIWVNGLEGCQTVNRAYEEFLGVPESSILGFEWTKHIHPDDRGAFMGTYLEAFSKHTGFNAQFRFRRHDGVYRWMRVVATPRIQGKNEFTGFVGCTFDISDLKEAENMLRDEDRRKDEFLATLSHELRNPLASLCSVSHLLSNDKNIPPALLKAHEVIERQTRNMARLVDDLLDITRVTHGTIQLRKERVDLLAPLESAISATQHLRKDMHQELRFKKPIAPLPVSGDPTRLEQIFVNLLTNAAKFTPPLGHVWVDVQRDESNPAEPEVAVCVRDDGEGISQASLPHIFDLFVQGSRSLGTIQAGVGIGLTLAQRLAQMHGGSIVATSAGLALGSEFTVRLPLLTAAEPAPTEKEQPMDANQPLARRILIVDDNVDAAETQGLLLGANGHEVRVTHDGPSALEIARSFLP
ncbi:MAG TPA: CheR family methyltransferase, partial [Planctomycetota bacterium]|nr:CheR family methyltransferase [Planctomycetota bacterium]